MVGATAKLPPRPEWFPEELALLRVPEPMKVSEWSDRFRILPVGVSSRHGHYQSSWTPYAREVMDAMNDPGVEMVTGVFGAQTGKSTIGENVLGYIIDREPSPIMWVMPTEADHRYVHGRRIFPMIVESPQLLQWLTERADDVTQEGIHFANHCELYYGNATSTRSLKGRSIRVLVLDEIDEMHDTPQGDPISMAYQRTNAFPNRKVFKFSTPTFPTGKVWQSWLQSDQRRFFVPCPHCGAYQVLVFEQVRWDDEKDPDKAREVARYECVECSEPISNAERRAMLQDGVWVPEGAKIDSFGRVTGVKSTQHRGYHLPSLYSPFLGVGELVYRFLTEDLGDFTRQMLAEPWEESAEGIRKDELLQCVGEYLRGAVPTGGQMLTCGIDVQGHRLGLYYVVRAWGDGGESWLVKSGNTRTWQGIEDQVLEADFGIPITFGFVDSGDGSRIDEVYEFCRLYRGVLAPSKGIRSMDVPFRVSTVDKHPSTGRVLAGGLRLWAVNTLMFKDMVHQAIHGSRAPWHVHENTEGVLGSYLSHMRSEHRVVRDGKVFWKTKPGKVRNDYWDCEVLAMAAWYRLMGQRSDGKIPAPRRRAISADEKRFAGRRARSGSSWLGGHESAGAGMR